MKKPETEIPSPIGPMTEGEMPEAPVSLATMEHRNTGLGRTSRPAFVEAFPACQGACPVGSDIEAWIRLLELGRPAEAYEAATLENPFPSITGRICTQPCTEACNRRHLGGAVNIRSIERAVGDSLQGRLPLAEPFLKKSGRRVAVVGAGPSGLSCAYFLSRLGHDVVIFESSERAGGALRYGVPPFRLPKEVLDREVARLAAMGIEIKTSSPVPDATHMQSLRQEFNAVYISIGAQREKGLGLGEEHIRGVVQGPAFLREASLGRPPTPGRRVVVVGGCNTAIDSARVAARGGAEVTVIFPGPREAMSAFPSLVEAAMEEGVRVETMTEPVKILTAGGRASAVACRRLAMAEADEEGRRRTIHVEGSEQEFDADTVIAAPGERIETSVIPSSLHVEGGAIRVDETGRTEWHNVFAGGDFTAGAHTLVHSIAAGKRAAVSIDCLLRGEGAQQVIEGLCIGGEGPLLFSRYVEMRTGSHPSRKTIEAAQRRDRVVEFGDLNCAYFGESAPSPAPRRGASERLSQEPFSEIEGPLAGEALASELSRCFHCGRCTECGNCYIYCPDLSISRTDDGYDLDLYHCKGCGVCSAECPRSAIEMEREEAGEQNG
ncbi:MAG: FAD-dependent oxidoreductase [Proteobacteria bacterium]|nr:FAD-dependent oxidoreductase [Pseudomonadota bacterium]